MTSIITDEQYRQEIEAQTSGFHKFTARRPQIGERRVFIYPDFGEPDSYPEYTKHRFHVVTVIREADDYDFEGERQFKVQADDGWKGSAWASELFPLPKGLA